MQCWFIFHRFFQVRHVLLFVVSSYRPADEILVMCSAVQLGLDMFTRILSRTCTALALQRDTLPVPVSKNVTIWNTATSRLAGYVKKT